MAAKDAARGKVLELHVGRLFGGRRRRNGEGVGFDDCIAEDGAALPISFECKAYSVLQLRQAWIDQARRNADGRPWAVVQRPKGSRTVYATVDLQFLHALARHAGLLTNHHPKGEPNVDGGRQP